MNKKPNPLESISSLLDVQTHIKNLPPVHKWNPPLNGDMDMLIRRDGVWLHEGTVIARKELVRLFSTILKREGDDYFLVTPVEKWRIRVEDLPLQAVSLTQTRVHGQPAIAFETLTQDMVVADARHPIQVAVDSLRGEPSPCVRVRTNLDARISRSVFYQLVDLARQEGEEWVVYSAGARFVLGRD